MVNLSFSAAATLIHSFRIHAWNVITLSLQASSSSAYESFILIFSRPQLCHPNHHYLVKVLTSLLLYVREAGQGQDCSRASSWDVLRQMMRPQTTSNSSAFLFPADGVKAAYEKLKVLCSRMMMWAHRTLSCTGWYFWNTLPLNTHTVPSHTAHETFTAHSNHTFLSIT